MSQTRPMRDYRSAPDNKNLQQFPGDYGYPLVGRALALIDDLLALSRDHYQRYGELSRIALGSQRGLLVLGADNYQRIFLDRNQDFSAEMGYAQQLGKFYTGGILLRDFDEHKFQRRMMQSAFKTAPMRRYVEIMNPMMQHALQQRGNGESFSFFSFIKETLLDVGGRIFIGIPEGDQRAKSLNDAFLAVNTGLEAVVHAPLPGTKYSKGMKGKQALHDYFASVIPERRAGQGCGDDMLTFLCLEKDDQGLSFSEKDITQHAAFLLFAAHDTTTSTLTHLVMYLGQNPQWQERLYAESLALGKAQIDYDDLEKLEGLDLCFNEVLRLHPSVPLMTRRTINEVELGGKTVPADTMLFLPTAFNQRDERWWSNPDQFDPDRFAPDREEQKHHSFCFHPFGGGAHKCIGMHFAAMLTKCFMHQLLLNYRIETPVGYAPKMQWIPLPRPADGVPMRLIPR